jgi:hypothetical protein
MSTSARRNRRLLTGGALLVLGACADEPKARGQLMLAISADLSIPENMNEVIIEVLDEQGNKQNPLFPIMPDPLGRPLPGTVAITSQKDGGERVRVRVIGQRNNGAEVRVRVVRDAVVTIPRGRTGMLTMPLRWLCDGEHRPSADGSVESSCGEGETCAGGRCVSAVFEEKDLPDYNPALVYGGGTESGEGGECIDVQDCFSVGFGVSPEGDCSITQPETAEADRINVALVLPQGGDGHCKDGECLVPLDRNQQEGWAARAGKLVLPPAACSRITRGDALGIKVTTACKTKDLSVPICGPWTNVSQRAPVGTGTAPTQPGERICTTEAVRLASDSADEPSWGGELCAPTYYDLGWTEVVEGEGCAWYAPVDGFDPTYAYVSVDGAQYPYSPDCYENPYGWSTYGDGYVYGCPDLCQMVEWAGGWASLEVGCPPSVEPPPRPHEPASSCDYLAPREGVRAVRLMGEPVGTVTLTPGCDEGGRGYVLSDSGTLTLCPETCALIDSDEGVSLLVAIDHDCPTEPNAGVGGAGGSSGEPIGGTGGGQVAPSGGSTSIGGVSCGFSFCSDQPDGPACCWSDDGTCGYIDGEGYCVPTDTWGGPGGAGGASAGDGELCCGESAVCVDRYLIPPESQSAFAVDSCSGGDLAACVPFRFLEDPIYLPYCTTDFGCEGRCLSACMPLTWAWPSSPGACGYMEECVPCYDPYTQEATGACSFGGDAPWDPPECGEAAL